MARLILVCCLLLSAPRAEAQLCQRSIASRVSPAGFGFLVEEVRGLIPDTFSIPSISAVVMDWPLTQQDARVEMGPTPGAVRLRGMDFVMTNNGGLRMRMEVDVNISGPATVSNAYAGFGSDRCQIDLQLSQVQFEADFSLETFGNRIAVELSETRVSSNEQQRVVRISDCTVGDIYNSLSSALGSETEVGTKQWLEEFARARVPALLEHALTNNALETPVPDSLLRFSAQLREARTSTEGLLLVADVAVEPLTSGFAPCLAAKAPPLAPSCDKPAGEPPLSDSMYAVSFSEGLVNRALHATWRTGLLCVDSNTLDIPEFSETIEKLSTTLGLAPGSRIAFQVTPQLPPTINFSLRDGARLMVEDLELKLQLDGVDGLSGNVQLRTSFSVAATPRLDPTTNSLGFSLGEVGIKRLELAHAGQAPSALQLDPARLQRFIAEVVMPLLRRQLERSKLTPSVVQAQTYLLALRNVFVADGYVSLHGDAHRPSTAPDITPPDTQLLEAPSALVGPQILPLKVGGTDVQTPAALLRFQVRVDGGAWSEPRFGGLVEVVAHGGQHHVEVAAVDLQGNVDPSPVALTLTVDDVPPEIRITQRPSELIKREQFSIGFAARDDRTAQAAIRFTTELLRVADQGGALEVVYREELPGGSSSARFPAQGKGLYRVRVTAHDQAGNVSSEEVGLLVESAGCSAVGWALGGRPAGWCLLIVVGLVALMRRGGRFKKRTRGGRSRPVCRADRQGT